MERLHDERAALELARHAAEREAAESAALRARLTDELEAAKAREKRLLSEQGADLLDRLRRARDELRDARATLRSKKVDASAVRDAERAIERVAGDVAMGGALEAVVTGSSGHDGPEERPPVGELRRGMRVWVQRLRAEADVVDVRADGSVRVAAGPLKLTVARAEDPRACATGTSASASRVARGGPRCQVGARGARHPDERQHLRISAASASTTASGWRRRSSIGPSGRSRSFFSCTVTVRARCATPSGRSSAARAMSPDFARPLPTRGAKASRWYGSLEAARDNLSSPMTGAELLPP